MDSKRDSSVLPYVIRLALDGQHGELNQHSKMAPNTAPRTTKTKSCISAGLEERIEGGILEQAIGLKDHATTYR